MKKNHVVSITGKQTIGTDTEEIQLIVPCYYKKDGSFIHLEYSEFDKNNEQSEIKSTLEIDQNNMVTLIRDGSQKSKLTLEKGKRHLCSYETEYGIITIGAYTNEIKYNLNEQGGYIELLYSLDVNTEALSTNLVVIEIKKGE